MYNVFYDGGNNGWGNMITQCDCGCIVCEQECDENGIPVKTLYDWSEEHSNECEDWWK